uniref:Uncharacterized protein n=1 Tax=Ralstonia solanacearum TaxID=305 RepID=A0A0S4TYF5_RALSL|nr:protein of unknown function [Ralstonia solanacearum]
MTRRPMADPKPGPSTPLTRLRERLAQKGHTLLDNEWRGRAARYRFRRTHGRETSHTGDHALRSLIDCPTCEAEVKLARLQQVARQAGGECLSTRYSKRNDTYRFRCQLGHEFETRGDRVLMGGWCPCCAPIRRGEARRDPTGLARIQEAARKRGGEWLPQPYARWRMPIASVAPRATSGRLAAWQWRTASGADYVRTRHSAMPFAARTGWTNCAASRRSMAGNALRITMKMPEPATTSGTRRGTSGEPRAGTSFVARGA